MVRHTSIGDLTGIATRSLVTKLGHGRANLQETLQSSAISWPFILGQSNLLLFPSLGILDLCGDRNNLIIEPASLLSDLGSAEALDRVFILHSPGNVEVVADVFAGLNHRLHAVCGILVLENILVEGLLKAVASRGHALGAKGKTDINAAERNLVGNILNGLQSGRAEAIDTVGARGVGESGSERSSPDFVSSSCIADLETEISRMKRSWVSAAHISHANILNQVRVEVAPPVDLLQKAVDHEVQIGVLETALLSFRQRRPDGQGDNNIVGILLRAGVTEQLAEKIPQGREARAETLTWR